MANITRILLEFSNLSYSEISLNWFITDEVTIRNTTATFFGPLCSLNVCHYQSSSASVWRRYRMISEVSRAQAPPTVRHWGYCPAVTRTTKPMYTMMPCVRRLEQGVVLSFNFVTYTFECPYPRNTQRVTLSYVTYRLATVPFCCCFVDGETRAESFVSCSYFSSQRTFRSRR